MIDDNTKITNDQEITRKKSWYLFVLFSVLLIAGIIAGVFIYWGKRGTKEPINNPPRNVAETPLDNLVPKNAKSPEDFLGKVQEKSTAIQKNYDNNLTEFARKRWEKLFWERNGAGAGLENNLTILSQEVQKTDDQSTLYKVKYRIKQGETELEMEDFYYLILSETKKAELGLSSLKSNVFLTEEDIKNNLTRENFVKIGKIQK